MLYVGSGPYCYANSFAMMFGEHGPPVGVIEVLTGAPFGMQLVGGRLPFFDPYGWDPEQGFDNVLSSLGWTSTVGSGGGAEDALGRLRATVAEGPVLVGPMELGYLRHQPGMDGPIGADHYVVVLEVDGERVVMHDPQGHPFATLPVVDFMAAWRKETVDYGEPFTMRSGFRRVAEVPVIEALRSGLPRAVAWLDMRPDVPVPPGTLGNGEAAEALAQWAEAGLDPEIRGHLARFAVAVGARRLADAAWCLGLLGLDRAAAVAREQSRLVGALQYPVTRGDDAAVATCLRELAPTYDKLRAVLQATTSW